MKNSKKLIVLLVALLALVGCGSKGNEGNELPDLGDRYTLDASTPAWKLDTKEETTKFTWYVNADWWNDEFGLDTVTKKIKEDLNIEIEFLVGDDTNLNTHFSGGELPDFITIFDSGSQVAKKAADWAYSLDDLAELYDPHFYEVAQEETLDWFKLSDDKTYGYPNYSNTEEDYDSGMIPAKTAFIIRQDVLDAISGLDFTTRDSFKDSMNKINEEFPELYSFGFNDMTDSDGSLGHELQDMIGVPLLDEEGNFYDRNFDSEYLEWLKVFRKLNDKEIISDDSFADDSTSFEEKVKNGKYATIFLGGTPQQGGNLQIFANANPGKGYVAVDAIQSDVYDGPTLNQSGINGWMSSYITNTNIDPIKAIQVFTYLLSEEGQILTTFGIEGETYEINDGSYDLLPEIKKLQAEDADRFKKEIRLGEFIFFGHDRYKALSEDSYVDAIKQMQEWGDGFLTPHFVLESIEPEQGTAEARSKQTIDDEFPTVLVSLIRSKSDEEFDSILGDYKNFKEDNNWDSVVEIYNEKIEANKEKLNIE